MSFPAFGNVLIARWSQRCSPTIINRFFLHSAAASSVSKKNDNRILQRVAPMYGCSSIPTTTTLIQQRRYLSTKDVFLRDLDPHLGNLVPDLPVPVPKLSLSELSKSGQSILDELELWAWWKPSSWMRWMLESAHIALDLPWWGTIICGTQYFVFGEEKEITLLIRIF